MRKYLLNEKRIRELLADDKIVLIDGGARGKIFPPFDAINKDMLQIIRFEPDSEADISDFSNDLIISKALWKESGNININIAEDESTSSVFPFNTDLQKHIDPHINLRKIKRINKVESISLDEFSSQHDSIKIDFIKLDIHGAEYEVLQGASKVLKTTLGLLIESWVIPIHKGQKLRAHVESLAYGNQFYVFEEFQRAKWPRMNKRFSKKQPVAIDTLFFKDPILDDTIENEIEAIKLIGIADLFLHRAYAWQLADHFFSKNLLTAANYEFLINHMKKHYRINKTMNKFFNKLESLIGRYNSICAFR